ncbi:hypothetical protein HMPREF1153_2312 [Selenomonas sp. CM52]|nr:hypothetical protein HMPREF1153_2312 [Selenomonas sp. CM52]
MGRVASFLSFYYSIGSVLFISIILLLNDGDNIVFDGDKKAAVHIKTGRRRKISLLRRPIFIYAISQTLPEHLHACVESFRAAVASERLAVEVGHVDVRVLHRRVACADGTDVYSAVISFVSR